MHIVYDMDKLLDVAGDGLSIDDDDEDGEDFRLTIGEEDSVLHVYMPEPIVIEGKTERVLR